ncbi:MAG: AsnC family transcriptional regulator [Candidatus Aramenus sulfurataquae]|jgi:nitrate reductase NapAB chaperone NapD|uniref:AsnC family transcriptional regulator n=2 Tax=Candidatus Aramenus sulfurataquae TaxID=1326980 RepID=W7KL50_9CREN|nr:MAG: AsnC family transcriptional regulator [Candidatus Aramenus sulfurataquae]MCL7343595.1 Lrp/AsnC ligand binding domain-containing protein [Candidatus Aramenus sulfurataquae]
MSSVKGYVLIITSIGKETDISNELKKIQGVREATPVYGEYDVVVVIEAQSLEELNKTISQIRRNPNIIRTVTLISM